MNMTLTARAIAAIGIAASLSFPCLAGPPVDWGNQLWDAARQGDADSFKSLIEAMPKDAGDDPRLTTLLESVTALEGSFELQAKARAESIAEARTELTDLLAGERTDRTLSKALAAAVRLEMLAQNHKEIINDPQVALLITKAEQAAKAAESRGDWLTANELFYRLNGLMEAEATYKDDLKRLDTRLSMLALYTPMRLWELRNDRAQEDAAAEGEEIEALPPFNAVGNDFRQKLDGIDVGMVRNALWQAAEQNVEKHPMRELLVSGLDAVEMLVTTNDLRGAFPGLDNEEQRLRFTSFIDRSRASLQNRRARASDMNELIDDLLRENGRTIKISDTAILHEFGNGAMAALDEFSGIIWPDEWSRFERNTSGSFVGVGIQIQMDEKQRIKVVTPLDGTPAQRAGVLRDDVIVKIDGEPTWGFTLNQAVDVITGPVNTSVALTVERASDDGEPAEKTFDITRKKIDLVTIKGWRRTGEAEDSWDWFIDPQSEIGYVRITNFDENTWRNLRAALNDMDDDGLQGLILDLRYNPGGLLDQAVEIANLFIDVDNGVIVSTHYGANDRGSFERADGRKGKLADMPTVVLINEGSASASEIVSGAIKHYADEGKLDAIVLGMRSFGKGSVQNVWRLTVQPTRAAVKITTQHYHLPDGQMIHRKPGSAEWGVTPHMSVDLLPSQIAESFTIRRNADLFDVEPIAYDDKEPTDDPNALLQGPDLQLQTALVLLKAHILAGSHDQAMLNRDVVAPGGG